MSKKSPDLKLNAKVGGWLEGILSQSSSTIFFLLTAFIVLIWILAKYILPLSVPYASAFALIFIGLIIVSVIIGFFYHLSKVDVTESLDLEDVHGNKVHIKSPSKNLLPAIINRLERNNVRPTKLIPKEVDLKGDPNQFKDLTEEEKDRLATEEVTEAITGTFAPPPPEDR